MPNTRSAKKALRQSKSKQTTNIFWKKRIREVVKEIKKQLKTKGTSVDIIKQEEKKLYKVVDKAAKNNVIHKNKAKRIKSSLSKKIAVHEKSASGKKETQKSKPGKGKSKSESKSS